MSDKSTPAAPSDQRNAPRPDEEPTVETLIEEVSIDGMCGVY